MHGPAISESLVFPVTLRQRLLSSSLPQHLPCVLFWYITASSMVHSGSPTSRSSPALVSLRGQVPRILHLSRLPLATSFLLPSAGPTRFIPLYPSSTCSR